MRKDPRLVHLIITNLIRLILFLTLILTVNSSRPLIQTIAAISLLITFIPGMLARILNINIPASFEILYLMFIYGLLMFGEQRGIYHGLWWWEVLMTFTASLALGFTALSIIHVLHKTSRINTNPILAAFLVFTITLSLATLWELFEFTLDQLLNTGLQTSLIDTMQDLSISLVGSVLVSIAGYNSIRTGSQILTSSFLTKILEKNSILLGPKRKKSKPESVIQDILKIGETPKIEFKSTIRTNLHTKQFDKRMELEILKTITAFLNSSGGNLLIGVSDEREVLGLEIDKFQNEDKMALHITNLIKNHIGNQFLPFIKFHITKIEDKRVMLIVCKESAKRVFMKNENKEEFYVRNGPSSVKLEGSSLVDYIQHKF